MPSFALRAMRAGLGEEYVHYRAYRALAVRRSRERTRKLREELKQQLRGLRREWHEGKRAFRRQRKEMRRRHRAELRALDPRRRRRAGQTSVKREPSDHGRLGTTSACSSPLCPLCGPLSPLTPVASPCPLGLANCPLCPNDSPSPLNPLSPSSPLPNLPPLPPQAPGAAVNLSTPAPDASLGPIDELAYLKSIDFPSLNIPTLTPANLLASLTPNLFPLPFSTSPVSSFSSMSSISSMSTLSSISSMSSISSISSMSSMSSFSSMSSLTSPSFSTPSSIGSASASTSSSSSSSTSTFRSWNTLDDMELEQEWDMAIYGFNTDDSLSDLMGTIKGCDSDSDDGTSTVIGHTNDVAGQLADPPFGVLKTKENAHCIGIPTQDDGFDADESALDDSECSVWNDEDNL